MTRGEAGFPFVIVMVPRAGFEPARVSSTVPLMPFTSEEEPPSPEPHDLWEEIVLFATGHQTDGRLEETVMAENAIERKYGQSVFPRFPQQGTIRVNPSEESIKIGPLGIRFLHTGDDPNGKASVFEVLVPSGQKLAAPAHRNDACEKILHGIEGGPHLDG